jgi:hypothetical protein
MVSNQWVSSSTTSLRFASIPSAGWATLVWFHHDLFSSDDSILLDLLVISPRWDQQQPQECLALPSGNDATVADALRFLLSVKQEFTSELYKYDEFMQIMGEFSRGRLVTVIAFYFLASQLADC